MPSRGAEAAQRRAWAIAALLTAVLVGCGGGASKPVDSGDAARSETGEAETARGRYTITLSVGARGSGAATACAPTAVPGSTSLPVVVTVANPDRDEAVPFPPLRVELLGPGSPGEVPVERKAPTRPGPAPGPTDITVVENPSPTCTFVPRVSALDPGASVAFHGATPPIPDTTPPGGVGMVQVSLSENEFSLSVPVP